MAKCRTCGARLRKDNKSGVCNSHIVPADKSPSVAALMRSHCEIILKKVRKIGHGPDNFEDDSPEAERIKYLLDHQ